MLEFTIICAILTLVSPVLIAVLPFFKDAGVSWPEEDPEHIIGRRKVVTSEWDQAPAQIEVVTTEVVKIHEPMVREGNTETFCLCERCYMSHMNKRPEHTRTVPPPLPIAGKTARRTVQPKLAKLTDVLLFHKGMEITSQDVDNFFWAPA